MSFGACFYKLPVLINMFKSRSGDGLNIYAVYLETSGYGSWMVYNILKKNSWSVYGDLIMTTIQNFLIIVLVWCWGISGKKISTMNIMGFLAYLILYITIVRIMPTEQYQYIAHFAILVTILSKLPQIVSNAQYGKVGVQSPITLLNGFLGATVKLFVSFVETKDILLVGSSLLSMLFNLILLSQVLYFSYYAPNSSNTTINRDGNEGKNSAVAVGGALVPTGTQKQSIKASAKKKEGSKSETERSSSTSGSIVEGEGREVRRRQIAIPSEIYEGDKTKKKSGVGKK
jgi:hypothetical protein